MGKIKHLILLLLVVGFLTACRTKEFKVNFETQTDVTYEERIVKSGETLTDLPTPEREGFDFKGWYLDDKFKTKYEEQKITDNTTLYAKWEVKTFTVTFKDDDTVLKTETVEYGKDATAPVPPTKEGYNFEGWDKDFTNVKSDLEVKATYNIKTYTVIFKVDGVQVGDTQTIEHGKSAQAPSDPTKDGHTFKGWDQEFNNVTSDLVINAVWEAQKFTVIFVDENDQEIAKVTVEYGKDAQAPTPPIKEGFVFDRWDKDFTNVTSDLTVKAIYKVATFEVRFFVEGVQIGQTQIIEYGKDAVAPEDPEITGKIFIEWDQGYTNVKSNLDIKAVFSLITYEISYYFGDEKLTHTPKHYTVDDEINLTPYQLEGFIFLGWYLDPEFKEGPVTALDPFELKSYVLYGKFLDADTVYSIEFELNGGSWTWTANDFTNGQNGIVNYSNLPHMFTLDFYTYLRDNNLLNSPLVNPMFYVTTWEEFSKQNPHHNGDPYALFNDTSSNTGQTNDGYSQLFFDTATGDPITGELIDVKGGFLGTEPYKSKYLPLLKHLALIFNNHYNSDYHNTKMWNGALGKTLLGFVLDGYFYGTQSFTRGNATYQKLRTTIPNTNAEYKIINNVVTKVDIKYNFNAYTPLVDGIEIYLPAPMKENHAFVGWYLTPDFTGNKVTVLKAGEDIPTKLYAKWELIQ